MSTYDQPDLLIGKEANIITSANDQGQLASKAARKILVFGLRLI